ncbi:hypothetical protein U3516DRAFT_750206 [Neocallimastix sp. 'constans']
MKWEIKRENYAKIENYGKTIYFAIVSLKAISVFIVFIAFMINHYPMKHETRLHILDINSDIYSIWFTRFNTISSSSIDKFVQISNKFIERKHIIQLPVA